MQPITPSARDLLAQVRAGFIARHTTLAEWCRAHGTHPSAARQAIYGTWAGPKGRELKEQLLAASGIHTTRAKRAA